MSERKKLYYVTSDDSYRLYEGGSYRTVLPNPIPQAHDRFVFSGSVNNLYDEPVTIAFDPVEYEVIVLVTSYPFNLGDTSNQLTHIYGQNSCPRSLVKNLPSFVLTQRWIDTSKHVKVDYPVSTPLVIYEEDYDGEDTFRGYGGGRPRPDWTVRDGVTLRHDESSDDADVETVKSTFLNWYRVKGPFIYVKKNGSVENYELINQSEIEVYGYNNDTMGDTSFFDNPR